MSFDWVTVAEGPFAMGSGQDEREVNVDAFQISRNLVTNEQYKEFVDATGHRAPTHWKDGEIPEGKEDHPVVNVSWHDVQAFCEWAGVRLPTETEWEKAARGTDGRKYPWGNEEPGAKHANFGGRIGDTTPVGSYPVGASPYGVYDMAGNVWEWTSSPYNE